MKYIISTMMSMCLEIKRFQRLIENVMSRLKQQTKYKASSVEKSQICLEPLYTINLAFQYVYTVSRGTKGEKENTHQVKGRTYAPIHFSHIPAACSY